MPKIEHVLIKFTYSYKTVRYKKACGRFKNHLTSLSSVFHLVFPDEEIPDNDKVDVRDEFDVKDEELGKIVKDARPVPSTRDDWRQYRRWSRSK